MSLYLGDIPIANDGSHRLTGEIGDMGFAPLGIDESLNLRRYLNGQVISQSLSPSFTTKVKQAIALFPNLGTTESNWQSEKTLSKLGQCGKFVVDDTEGTIRLPAVVNPQGLLSLSAIGTIKDESLPNITGNVSSLVDRQSGAFLATEVSSASIAGGSAGKIYDNNFNASRSSSAYQNNAPVQQEAIQYPYYIQIATGVEETLPAIREYEINTPYFFGQSMYSENAPYNASWLASNGQYNASTLYPDFWVQLTGVELNTSLNVGDTIEISGKTYVKRGLPVVLSTGTYTDYDFVVNQNDQTFRLPLLNGEEDLPDYSNQINVSSLPYTAPCNGVFIAYTGTVPTGTTANIFADGRAVSRCRNTFNSTTAALAMPPATILKGEVITSDVSLNNGVFYPAKGNGTLYYYVGDTVQDASLINAGAVLEQLSNKADIDLSNVNNTGNVAASNLNSKGIRTVVETYKSGENWYRKWSDGWIEQGGVITASYANAGQTINLLKPFTNKNYTINVSAFYASDLPSGGGSYGQSLITSRSTTSFKTAQVGSKVWYACGY